MGPRQVSWIVGVLALVTGGRGRAEEAFPLPGDPEPILVSGSEPWEGSVTYGVTFEPQAAGRAVVRVEIPQDNRTRDRLRLHVPSQAFFGLRPIDEQHALDATYALFGFRPLRDGEVLMPPHATG